MYIPDPKKSPSSLYNLSFPTIFLLVGKRLPIQLWTPAFLSLPHHSTETSSATCRDINGQLCCFPQLKDTLITFLSFPSSLPDSLSLLWVTVCTLLCLTVLVKPKHTHMDRAEIRTQYGWLTAWEVKRLCPEWGNLQRILSSLLWSSPKLSDLRRRGSLHEKGPAFSNFNRSLKWSSSAVPSFGPAGPSSHLFLQLLPLSNPVAAAVKHAVAVQHEAAWKQANAKPYRSRKITTVPKICSLLWAHFLLWHERGEKLIQNLQASKAHGKADKALPAC